MKKCDQNEILGRDGGIIFPNRFRFSGSYHIQQRYVNKQAAIFAFRRSSRQYPKPQWTEYRLRIYWAKKIG